MDLKPLYKKELFENIMSDTNTVEVKYVADIFTGTVSRMLDCAECFKIVREKVTESEFENMLESLATSFLVSLYCSSAKNGRQLKKRMKLATKTGGELMDEEDDEDEEE